MTTPRLLGAAAVLAAALVNPAAVAQTEPERRAVTNPSVGAAEPLRVAIDVGQSGIELPALQREIEREIGRPVSVTSAETAALSVQIQGENRLVVRYVDPRSGELQRTVDLPKEPQRAAEVIALLVGNVVRDEASELLRSLEAESAEVDTQPDALATSAEAAPASEPAEPPTAKPPQPVRPPNDTGLRTPIDQLIDGPLKLNFSVASPLALLPDSSKRRLNVELGLLYSHIGAIEGAAVSLGVLSVERHARGVSVGTVWARVRGPTRGALVSALVTHGGPVLGVSVAGAASYHRARVRGVQAASLLTVADDFEGVQVAGAVTVAKRVRGATVAGGATWTEGHLEGASAAGGFTFSDSGQGVVAAAGFNRTGAFRGLMLAGGANIAREVSGLSVALVNIAERVDGAQVGVVNIAERVEGTSLGFVSIAGNGRVQPTVWSSTAQPLHVGVKFVVGYTYSELSWAFDPSDETNGPEWGAGLHFELPPGLYLEPGVHYSELHQRHDWTREERGELQVRGRVGVRLFDRFDLFAGGGMRHGLHGTTRDERRPEAFAGVAVF